MKRRRKADLFAIGKRTLKALGLTVVGVATMRSAQATTTVIGDGLPHNVDIPINFASNAAADGTGFTVGSGLFTTGTPNIGLTWGSGASHSIDSYATWDGRGPVIQLDYNAQDPISISFTPDPGWGVLISSFDMDEFSGGGSFNVDWSIFDGIGTLASGNWQRSTGGRDTILTGLTAGAINGGQVVTLRFTHNSGSGSYFAIDNLVFDQVQIPEPSTVALAAMAGLVGLGAVAMRRRRK